MKLETSTLMLLFFLIIFVISIWKIYAFLPNKQLEDDDTTEESINELISIMLDAIKDGTNNIDIDELYIKMVKNENFDKDKFWRFNKNRLNKLLELYYLKNPQHKSIKDIYKEIKA